MVQRVSIRPNPSGSLFHKVYQTAHHQFETALSTTHPAQVFYSSVQRKSGSQTVLVEDTTLTQHFALLWHGVTVAWSNCGMK